jgi:hypothetical protein
MKPLLMLLAVVLLSVGAIACGSSGSGTGSASQASSGAATSGGATSTTSSTGSAQTSSSSQKSNNVSTYGKEAGEPDKREITALVNRYYVAAAADDGANACSLIYSVLAEAIPEDYGRPPGPLALRGKTCAAVMSKLFKRIPRQPSAVLATTMVTDVRVSGKRGWVGLKSSAMPSGEIIVEREHNSWKIDTLIGGSVQ